MHFGKGESEEHGLEQIRSGVHEIEDIVDRRESELSELFVSLKQDILATQVLTADHVRVLQKQVRHILSVARAIHYPELEQAFEQEEQVLCQMEDLFEHYPRMDVGGSADLQATLKNLQSMIASQQDMIFKHKEIMEHEKQRLIQILQEAQEIESDYHKQHDLSSVSSNQVLH